MKKTKSNYILALSIAVCSVAISSCDRKEKISEEPKIAYDSVNLQEQVVLRGKYLVTIGGCNDCHSTKVMGPKGPEIDSTMMLAGSPAGSPLPEFPTELIKKRYVVFSADLTAGMGPWGTSFAANLTPDDTGIGNWKEEQFVNALRHGKYKGLDDARMLMPPMPWQNFAHFTQEDIHAIFMYLKSIPPVSNVVPTVRPPDAQ